MVETPSRMARVVDPLIPKAVTVVRAWDRMVITSWWDQSPTSNPDEIEDWFVIQSIKLIEGAEPQTRQIRLTNAEAKVLAEVIKHG